MFYELEQFTIETRCKTGAENLKFIRNFFHCLLLPTHNHNNNNNNWQQHERNAHAIMMMISSLSSYLLLFIFNFFWQWKILRFAVERNKFTKKIFYYYFSLWLSEMNPVVMHARWLLLCLYFADVIFSHKSNSGFITHTTLNSRMDAAGDVIMMIWYNVYFELLQMPTTF